MTIGYENPNGDPSKVAPVSSLTNDEKILKARIKTLTATVQEGERAKRQVEAIQKACPHRVFNDSDGIPYNFRMCFICGAHMGRV